MIIKQEINSNIEINKLEDLVKLKALIEESNLKVNLSEIARELGCDRRTVKKYIRGYEKVAKRNRKSPIDDYYSLIQELLNSETRIFYYKRVLWQYLVDNHGLKVKQSTFRGYISRHPEFNKYFKNKRKSAVSNNSVLRFETSIGEQAQLDWKETMKIILSNGEVIIINIFVLILSYSRFRVYRISLDKTQEILFSFLDDAFNTFGGVPREILCDNMKTIMDAPRTEYSKGKVNNKFSQFAHDYGFKVRPCIAGKPNTKAKVESPMRLLDELYAYSGHITYEELILKVKELNERINAKCHTTTGKIPILHLKKEQDFLLPLPQKQIRSLYRIKTTTVKVNPQSLICFKSNFYSVPPEYIGSTLKLQVYDNKIHVYNSTNLIALHDISNQKLNYTLKDYIALSGLTFNSKYIDINKLAKDNLNKIGDIYNE
jgi:transposase